MEQEIIQTTPMNTFLSTTIKHNKPAIELRKLTTDADLIKTMIISAFYETPMQIQPKFNDRIKAINSLMEKGILFYNKETEQYEFLI